jgi:hypothetical protein
LFDALASTLLLQQIVRALNSDGSSIKALMELSGHSDLAAETQQIDFFEENL